MPISFSSPVERDQRSRGHGVTAVLGPTNTGKTHLAIERMLSHSSGMIGLPLRLLAREVYNKVVERVGADAVALVTGEEKIKPANARFWVSTVEAMPRDLDVAFLAVDEVQLGADLERGHVFTDRMLNRRGREETLVLGAATIRPMVEKLLPGANILSRPRLSQLTYAGKKRSPASRPGPPLWRSPPTRSMPSPSSSAGSAAARLWYLAPYRRARETLRWLSTSPATWTIWSRPMPSAWGSTLMSITWPLRRTASSTAISSGGSIRPNSPRSRDVPAAPRAMGPSAPPAAAGRSIPTWCAPWKATASSP